MNLMRPKLYCIALFLLFIASCNESPKITTASVEATRLYFAGVDHLQKFHYAEAKLALDSALHLDPHFAMAYARAAYLHFNTGDEDSARILIGIAMKSLENVSRYEGLHIRLMDNIIHFRNDDAAVTADSLIELFPTDAEAYVLRGNLYEHMKHYDAALGMYAKALSVDSTYAPAAMSLGYAYSAQGEGERAIRAMERYIRLVPDAADPRASYADVLLRLGRYDEALEQYRTSLKFKPDYWYAINRIGDVYAIKGQLKEASKHYALGFSKMIANNQTRSGYVAIEADLAMKRGEYHDALRLFDQALTLDTLSLRARFGMVLALSKLRKFAQADSALKTIRPELERRQLTESGAMLDYHALRARLYEEQDNIPEAFAACDSALRYGTAISRAEIFALIARLYLRSGDYDGSLDALDEALRYNPASPRALLTLTKVYHAMGDRRMTNEIGQRLVELWKNADDDYLDYIELKKTLAQAGIRA